MDARPEVSEYGSVDPAPASDFEELDHLRNTLLDENEKMFQRMRSVFKLRNIRTTIKLEPDEYDKYYNDAVYFTVMENRITIEETIVPLFEIETMVYYNETIALSDEDKSKRLIDEWCSYSSAVFNPCQN